MDRPMEDMQITGNQIEKWLSEYFQQPLKLKSCRSEKIAIGEGFTSIILRVSLEYENGHASFPKSVIVKTPSLPALEDLMKKLRAGKEFNIDEAVEFSMVGHSAECAAYRVFGKDPPIPLPVIYASTECHKGRMGAIVMEDMSGKSAIIGDPTCTLSLEQLYEATDAVASWHAWCLTTGTDWQSHFEPADSERRKQIFAGWFERLKNSFKRVKSNYPNAFNKIDVEVARRMFNMHEFSKIIQKHRSIIPDVIVHGDFYGNNLMYDISKDETGKVTIGSKLVCIIDWALSHRGCGLSDFARLLVQGVDTETRRRHTVDALRRYYDGLVKKAGIEKVKASFEDVLKVYDDKFVFAGMVFVLLLDSLQNLFVPETGAEGEKKRKILFERCLAAYEDCVPIMEKAKSLGAGSANS